MCMPMAITIFVIDKSVVIILIVIAMVVHHRPSLGLFIIIRPLMVAHAERKAGTLDLVPVCLPPHHSHVHLLEGPSLPP